MAAQHIPVLLEEVVRGLNPQPGQNFVDGTVGGGGHARALLEATAPSGRLLALDRDAAALTAARLQLARFGSRVTFIHDSFSNLASHVSRAGLTRLDGVLFDLGLSSDQLADARRGFSFLTEGELDLRFDKRQGPTAADLLNSATAQEIETALREYGDEPQARALSRALVTRRRLKPFATTSDLLEVVHEVKGRGGRSHHPGTLVWQALRLWVNNELDELVLGLKAALAALSPEGRLAVITFHSGEDRIVKNFFRTESRDCICPPELPACRCSHRASLKLLTRRAIVPQPNEVRQNPRARSAQLRLVQKLASK